MFIIKTSRDVGTIWENYLTQIQHIQYITAINEKEKIFSYLLCVFPSPHHIQSFWLEFIIVSRCPQVLVMLMHTYPPTQIHTHTHIIHSWFYYQQKDPTVIFYFFRSKWRMFLFVHQIHWWSHHSSGNYSLAK